MEGVGAVGSRPVAPEDPEEEAAMSWGYAIVGGLVGLVTGMALGARKAARSVGTGASCPVSDVSRWMTSRGETGVLISSRMELPNVPADKSIDSAVTQDTCTVFVPNDAGEWVRSDELTRELADFLTSAPNAPVSRPTPNNVDIPAGPRPVP